ncbi:6-pyruvoyl trahydropterin synthase family protein [Chitinophaga flava]|uniref:6-carboxy-5,6,7,8-tetrahydropterin synthase n=1 Tax=Chitinophaga flava TaxID=2259036 RepID=A0A365XSG0_9BACT|nr:6-carboxytetrahydropterin synthase [Chitinophaga flava]RBL89070.1 6-carboxytetrahydropterin synthase QueD [Chitinophaga flava]
MLQLTKIFSFETAHALHRYNGKCRNIHGHSYKLHVTVRDKAHQGEYLPAPGILVDFKDIKAVVQSHIVEHFDHRLILSADYVVAHPFCETQENLWVWEMEPSAENMVLYMQKVLQDVLPAEVSLASLRLYETSDSYAEWVAPV